MIHSALSFRVTRSHSKMPVAQRFPFPRTSLAASTAGWTRRPMHPAATSALLWPDLYGKSGRDQGCAAWRRTAREANRQSLSTGSAELARPACPTMTSNT